VRSFRIETIINAPAGACFDLSLSGVTVGVMKLGDTVTWQARHFGIPFRMTSAITEYEHPGRFVDEQLRGDRSAAGGTTTHSRTCRTGGR
jgi:hypothetical protein